MTWRRATRAPTRPGLAITLTNLGVLYSDTGRLADAETAYGEALTLYRALASGNPTAYSSQIEALTEVLALLRNLASAPGR